jgi:hypothetical protein
MTPMNQRKETREKSTSPTMKKPKGTLHPRASDGSNKEGLHSNTSINDDEGMSVANGG